MMIRTKILLALAFVWSAYFAVELLYSFYMLDEFTEAVEKRELELEIERCHSLLDNEQQHLNTLVFSALHLNQLLNRNDTSPVSSNLPNLLQNEFSHTGLNLLAIYDKQGRRLHGGLMNLKRDEIQNQTEFNQDQIPADHPLLLSDMAQFNKAGFYISGKSVWMISAHVIFEENTGPQPVIQGTIIGGRVLTTEALGLISRFITLPFELTLQPIPHTAKPLISPGEPGNPRILADFDNAETMTAYLPIKSINSNRLSIRAPIPRVIHKLVYNDITIQLLFLIGVILGLFGLLVLILQSILIRPMAQLTRYITARQAGETGSEFFALKRKDEIGLLSKEFEKLLQNYEDRNREITLLDDLDNLLGACDSMKEAGEVITRIATFLFKSETGAVSIINNSQNLFEHIATWGDDWPGERVFAPNDCWAIRRGQPHRMGPDKSNAICRHLPDNLDAPTICLPMMAHGSTLGVLHLKSHAGMPLDPSKVRLVALMAEHTSLALSNLRLREALRIQAIRDPLTGLYNRRFLEESLERELSRARRKEKPMAVFMIDIDHFKLFNDNHGHEAGDYVLKQLGLVLNSFIRREDVACRYGGEEFTLILPGAPEEVALQRANELCERMRKLDLRFSGDPLGTVTISVGVAVYPTHGEENEALIGAADRALYRAKADGRDRAVLAD